MNEDLKLYRYSVYKNDKRYTDVVLVWNYQGTLYHLRIEPVFKDNYKILLGKATKVNKLEDVVPM